MLPGRTRFQVQSRAVTLYFLGYRAAAPILLLAITRRPLLFPRDLSQSLTVGILKPTVASQPSHNGLSDFPSTTALSGGFPGSWGVKNLAAKQETWVQSLGQKDPLKKEIATRFSILAWEIPWTEELCGLQSMGSQRVRHDWATSLSLWGREEFWFGVSSCWGL